MIYFDNNATTPVDPLVLEGMLPYLQNQFGNPSSAYKIGRQAKQAVAKARGQIAALVGAEPEEIVFTSCGTESDNTAINAALNSDPDRKHLITSRVEHSAINNQAQFLARRGYEVTWLEVDSLGRPDLDQLRDAIRPDTAIVSLMWANNETGVLFPIQEIAEICRERRTVFHTDAVQAAGKLPIDLGSGAVQFLSLSGHKLHAPKGIGALYVNRRTRFSPYLFGGGQEGGKRSGTENVPYIAAFGRAAELALNHLRSHPDSVRAVRDRFEHGMLERIPGVSVNGDREHRLSNTTNLRIEGVDSEAMLIVLDQQGLCCSAGSACTTGSLVPSHVLKAMGLADDQARSSLRFSFSRMNTFSEVDQALDIIDRAVKRVRSANESLSVSTV
ncbi:MAG: cysteine desulfurase NifS [Verrucomicrobia bacterium]|nr:cysteine desulfurase NifS [Verrucomicrobiota bacterium]